LFDVEREGVDVATRLGCDKAELLESDKFCPLPGGSCGVVERCVNCTI